LIIFSTSSTAYVGITLLVLISTISAMTEIVFIRRVRIRDLSILVICLILFMIALGIYLYDENVYDPFRDLIQSMVFNKADSESGQERSYWNEVGLKNLVDTYGLGVGMGSSRTSSWIVSVLSQLGIFGTILFAVLFAEILNGSGRIRVSGQPEVYALISST